MTHMLNVCYEIIFNNDKGNQNVSDYNDLPYRKFECGTVSHILRPSVVPFYLSAGKYGKMLVQAGSETDFDGFLQ